MRWLIIFVLCCPAFAATDLYIASASAGSNNGTSCANARALSSLVSGDWIGDQTIHLCGTLTASAGTNSYIQALGSGTSGHPIILKWETGTIVQAPYWGSSTGAVDCNTKNFLTIDGGVNGILQTTANGTLLANQQNSIGIYCNGSSNIIIQNLTIGPLYVHTSVSDENGGTAYGVDFQNGSNNTVGPNNVIHDTNLGVLYGFSANVSAIRITQNTFYNTNQSIEVGNIGAFTLTGLLEDNNICHDWANWDDTANNNHHNCIHNFAVGSAGSITGTYQVYNNYAYGDLGNHATSMFFFENNGGGISDAPKVFNNVFNHNVTTNASANGLMRSEASGGLLANNTFIDAGGTSGNAWNCLDLASNTWTVENNIFQGCATYIYLEPTHSLTTMNFNDFYLGGPQWVYQSSFLSTIGTWRTACSCDASSVTTTPNLNSSFQPVATSGAIAAGTDLSGLSITALNSDKNGNARSAPWTIGALNAGSTTFVPSGGFLIQ